MHKQLSPILQSYGLPASPVGIVALYEQVNNLPLSVPPELIKGGALKGKRRKKIPLPKESEFTGQFPLQYAFSPIQQVNHYISSAFDKATPAQTQKIIMQAEKVYNKPTPGMANRFKKWWDKFMSFSVPEPVIPKPVPKPVLVPVPKPKPIKKQPQSKQREPIAPSIEVIPEPVSRPMSLVPENLAAKIQEAQQPISLPSDAPLPPMQGPIYDPQSDAHIPNVINISPDAPLPISMPYDEPYWQDKSDKFVKWVNEMENHLRTSMTPRSDAERYLQELEESKKLLDLMFDMRKGTAIPYKQPQSMNIKDVPNIPMSDIVDAQISAIPGKTLIDVIKTLYDNVKSLLMKSTQYLLTPGEVRQGIQAAIGPVNKAMHLRERIPDDQSGLNHWSKYLKPDSPGITPNPYYTNTSITDRIANVYSENPLPDYQMQYYNPFAPTIPVGSEDRPDVWRKGYYDNQNWLGVSDRPREPIGQAERWKSGIGQTANPNWSNMDRPNERDMPFE